MWWKIPTHFCVLVLPCGFLSCWKVQEFVAYCNNAIWNHFFNSCSIIWNNCLVSIYDFSNQIKCTIWLHTRYANYSYWRTRIYYTVELEEIFRSSDKGVPCGLRNFFLVAVSLPVHHIFFNYMCWGKFSLHVWKNITFEHIMQKDVSPTFTKQSDYWN